ncbi:MAG: GIY-YIG nuclease family protein [Candidatus Aenigmatarchaeota archaeon]
MWKLYVLRLSDDSLYTGITKDIQRRLEQHRRGEGSKYVRSRLPLKLVYTEEHEDKGSALKKEVKIKNWDKERKERFVGND